MSTSTSIDLVPISDKCVTPITKLSDSTAGQIQRERQEERKKLFFNEVIHLALLRNQLTARRTRSSISHLTHRHENEFGNSDIQNESKTAVVSSWKVQRYRLNVDFLQHLVNMTLKKVSSDDNLLVDGSRDVAYLKHYKNGSIILPDDIQLSCSSDPDIYYVILSHPNKTNVCTTTQYQSSFYEGEFKFIVHNVPTESQNGCYTVNENNIKHWIEKTILIQIPDIREKENQRNGQLKVLETIQKDIESLPAVTYVNKRGSVIRGKEADRAREEQYTLLLKKRNVLHEKIENIHDSLNILRAEKYKELSDTLRLINSASRTTQGRNSWSFYFVGNHKTYFEKLTENVRNWNRYFIYATPDDVYLDLVTEHYSTSDGEILKSLNDYLVDTGAVSVVQVQHGLGCFYKCNWQLNPNLSISHVDHIDCYHGSYKEGLRSGNGSLYTSSYIYVGDFSNNMPCGSGTFLHKDGDFINGQSDFSHSLRSLDPSIKCYARGLPHGYVSVQFSDGGVYEGQMNKGEITGEGTYTSNDGDKFSGYFVKGLLRKGKVVFCDGDVMSGNYENGLQGLGSYYSKTKCSFYSGWFVDGIKHGKGREVYRNRSHSSSRMYTGYYKHGKRSGFGCFSYSSANIEYTDKLRLKLSGQWFVGKLKKCLMMNTISDSLPPSSHVYKMSRWLYRLNRVEDLKDKRKNVEKLQNVDKSRRWKSKIESKKQLIFGDGCNLYRTAIEQMQTSMRGEEKSLNQYFIDEVIQANSMFLKQKLENVNESHQKLLKKYESTSNNYELPSPIAYFIREMLSTVEDHWHAIDNQKRAVEARKK